MTKSSFLTREQMKKVVGGVEDTNPNCANVVGNHDWCCTKTGGGYELKKDQNCNTASSGCSHITTDLSNCGTVGTVG